MDVDQAAFVMAHEAFGEDAHEAGQDHQVRRVGVDGLGQGGIKGFPAGVGLVIQGGGGDAGGPGSRNSVKGVDLV